MELPDPVLPNGTNFLLALPYTTAESHGIITLVVVSSISAAAVLGLLSAIALSAFNTRYDTTPWLFVRTHVVVYFVCLICCDLLQATGSMMNIAWIKNMEVQYGGLCIAQGILKQIADVGIALWSLVIALHTFCVLVVRLKLSRISLWGTLIATWSAIAAIVISGPVQANGNAKGPFYGIAGQWCWIAPAYDAQRVTVDYLIMFMSAILSFFLYMLVFLRLRGNIVSHGWHFQLRFREVDSSWRGVEKERKDDRLMAISRQMLMYPVAYTIIILPIAASRFSSWFNNNSHVPFAVTIFADTIYLLSGLTNTLLFTFTRRVLPPRTVLVRPKFTKESISAPQLIPEPKVVVLPSDMEDPYYSKSGYRGGKYMDDFDQSADRYGMAFAKSVELEREVEPDIRTTSDSEYSQEPDDIVTTVDMPVYSQSDSKEEDAFGEPRPETRSESI